MLKCLARYFARDKNKHMLDIKYNLPLKVQNGGLFISRGVGSHPQRVLDSWVLIYVVQGKLSIKEEESDFIINQGECLILYPHRQHQGLVTFPKDLKFYWLHFELNEENNLLNKRPIEEFSLPQYSKLSDEQNMTSLFRQFLSEQENHHRSSVLDLLLLLMLQHIARANSETATLSRAGDDLAWKAQQLIHTHFHQPISTSTLAAQLYCNPDYLGRVYRKTFQITITDAIHRQRVNNAEKLLLTDACSLSEIALRNGFSDVAYFRQIFRKLRGITPAEWKRRYCKEHINSD
jgi:AraC-like DNA-binding protein